MSSSRAHFLAGTVHASSQRERSCGSRRMPLAGLNVRHLRKLTLKKWWRQFLWTDGCMIKPLTLNATQPQARGQMGQRLISLMSWGLFLGLGWSVLQWLSACSHLCLLLLLLCGSLIWAVNLTSFSRIEFILHWIQGIKNTGKLLGSDKQTFSGTISSYWNVEMCDRSEHSQIKQTAHSDIVRESSSSQRNVKIDS